MRSMKEISLHAIIRLPLFVALTCLVASPAVNPLTSTKTSGRFQDTTQAPGDPNL